MKKFTNKNRKRFHGLRKGDIVKARFGRRRESLTGKIASYGIMDNNRVHIKLKDKKIVGWVAEWCKILVKVEKRQLRFRRARKRLTKRYIVGYTGNIATSGKFLYTEKFERSKRFEERKAKIIWMKEEGMTDTQIRQSLDMSKRAFERYLAS